MEERLKIIFEKEEKYLNKIPQSFNELKQEFRVLFNQINQYKNYTFFYKIDNDSIEITEDNIDDLNSIAELYVELINDEKKDDNPAKVFLNKTITKSILLDDNKNENKDINNNEINENNDINNNVNNNQINNSNNDNEINNNIINNNDANFLNNNFDAFFNSELFSTENLKKSNENDEIEKYNENIENLKNELIITKEKLNEEIKKTEKLEEQIEILIMKNNDKKSNNEIEEELRIKNTKMIILNKELQKQIDDLIE